MPTIDTEARHFLSFGIVSTASTTTGARVTANLTDPTAAVLCQAISFQAITGGTGIVYICNAEQPTLGDGVEAGVLWEVLPSGVGPSTRPFIAAGNPTGTNPLNAAELYILPEVSGEGLRITGIL